MADLAKPLVHADAERKDDETLRQEARAHFEVSPALQLVAELLTKLRTLDLAWWSPEKLRARWPAVDRMRWLAQRPDLRQQITTQLTGLARKAARKKAPDFQAALVDSVVDEGDVTASHFEDAFDPIDLAVYGPADAMWRAFVEVMPWSSDTAVHQELVAWLLEALLTDKGSLEGARRKPILTAWELRTSIDGRVWHQRVPLDVRVGIDEARLALEREKPAQPFAAAIDLKIATPHVLATNVPLVDLKNVFATAERAMGFSLGRPRPDGTRPDGPRTEASPRALDVRSDVSPAATSVGTSVTSRKSTPPPAAQPQRTSPSARPPAQSTQSSPPPARDKEITGVGPAPVREREITGVGPAPVRDKEITSVNLAPGTTPPPPATIATPVAAPIASDPKIKTMGLVEEPEDGESTNPWLTNPLADEESTEGTRKKLKVK